MKYRTAERVKQKRVVTKYPLQPLDAIDKFSFASMLGDLRRDVAREQEQLERYTYTLKNLFRYNYTKEEIEELKQEQLESEQRIAKAEQVLKDHEAWVEYLLGWEEALDTLKRAAERGKALEKAGKVYFVSEGRFEKERFERAIKSVAPVEHYEPIELESGEYFAHEVKLIESVYNWLKIKKIEDIDE